MRRRGRVRSAGHFVGRYILGPLIILSLVLGVLALALLLVSAIVGILSA